ncbi:Multidrug resistance protein 1 [Schistosoma japonicum]|nr:Multidrug resistance protein 1 [Schistosoma japonicum]
MVNDNQSSSIIDNSINQQSINKNSIINKVSFRKLFQYTTLCNKCLIFIGNLCSIILGISFPASILIFRSMINGMFNSSIINNANIYELLGWYFLISIIMFILCMCKCICIQLSTKRIVKQIQLLYYQAVLQKDILWFDEHSPGDIIHNLSENINSIESGIGIKLSDFNQNMSGFLAGIIIGFIVKWKLALVACATLPFVVVAFSLFAYSRASTVSSEVLSSIRTVIAFGGEKRELLRYQNELSSAESMGIKKATAFGGAGGCIGCVIFASASLVFWYGVKLIQDENTDPGAVIAVFINILLGSIFLGNALPNIPYIFGAVRASKDIFAVINHVSEIEQKEKGKIIPNFDGSVSFRYVNFTYPSRPDVTILANFCLTIKSGQTIALVGSSGSGKSTIIHMLQRFYDPTQGEILIQGVNLRELNIIAYRNQIGCVQQEPILFDGTIRENIRLGKLDATDEEIEEAAIKANAHQFIMRLPQGYNTLVGEKGSGLSGGQKQRIAIARVLIRKPKLLLLDEATSALDTQSERIVQAALDKIVNNCTVLVIAHRLSTIINADCIIVLEQGCIREMGKHDELLKLNGLYATMFHGQDNDNKQQKYSTDSEDEYDQEETKRNFPYPRSFPIDNDCYSEYDSASTASFQNKTVQWITTNINTKINRLHKSLYIRLLSVNRPEFVYNTMGCFCSIISGLLQPAFSLLYSEVYEVFSLRRNADEMTRKINTVSGILAGLGFLQLIIGITQGYLFGVSAERLTKRLRSNLFDSMLKQEIGWFDRSENQASALTAFLSTDASKVAQISGSRLSTALEAIVLIIASLVIGFIYSWQLTLVMIPFIPLLLLSSRVHMRSSQTGKTDENLNQALCIAKESVSGHRTVKSLSLEEYFYQRFKLACNENFRTQIIEAIEIGLVQSIALSGPILCLTACFALGNYLIQRNDISMIALFRVYITFTMCSQALGRITAFSTNTKTAEEAMERIFTVLDRIPIIETDKGDKPKNKFKGYIEFKHVNFRYPTRPSIKVIKNFSFHIQPGTKIALVGQSGCGKSTIVQLLQRFYDPTDHGLQNGIFFDGINLRQLSPCWIRQQIGIVSQEPILFNLTLRENIAYGDNSRDVSMDEIIEAAKLANIHDFILSLPEAYETLAGQDGSHLSGGQKQRIAIARALIRKPTLLLLDEATSALDNENQRLVQKALDDAMVTRTSIIVAHRLNTIDNVDLIIVLSNGQISEYGKMNELIAKKGEFYHLYRLHNTK